MELGMIGLGKMGANMAQRLVRGGHRVVGFDPGAEARARAGQFGAESVESLQAMVAALATPRAVWMMVPAGDITGSTVDALFSLLSAGDSIIDGVNSIF
jgi:6-phosphogluconate dehydrogenase